MRLHRRGGLRESDVTVHDGIPVTTPTQTLIDLAVGLDPHRLERAVNQADVLDLVDPVTLLESLDGYTARGGVGKLRALLDGSGVLPHRLRARAPLPAIGPRRAVAGAADRRQPERIPGRLLLARAWGSSSRPTGCAITAHRGSRRGIGCETRRTPPRA